MRTQQYLAATLSGLAAIGASVVRELSVSVRMGRCFRKKEPIESGSPMPGEQGVNVVADAVAEVVADDAHAIEANDQWIAVAGG
jgi:hypothetical protein